ncbi:MAG TPA: 30S ribosomal protein S6 [Candidatus Kapabacteria bacterium]|nr:30S ribosomal protein S6 [Candidatus Kapabacteria bacterium]
MQKRLYETTVVFNGALEDSAIEQLVTRVNEFISQNGGQIGEQEHIGRRRLIYPIKKRTSGYYYGVRFNASAELVGRLEKMYVLEEQILRFLTLVIDDKLLRTRAANQKRAEERQKEQAAKLAAEEIGTDIPKVIPQPVNN